MKRSTFFAIVIGGSIIIVFVIVFFFASNPYERLNPTPEPVAEEEFLLPSSQEAVDRELITIGQGDALGMTIGIDGQRIIYFDLDTNMITVTEFDGSALQRLSEVINGVQMALLAPSKDQLALQLSNPDSTGLATIIYDLRTKESVRLEDGIVALDWSPDGGQLVYYVAREGAAPALRIVSASGAAPKTIRDNFKISNPTLDWYSENAVAVGLQPESDRAGSLVSISVDGLESFELVAQANALQAKFSPDGLRALVSYNDVATNKSIVSLLDIKSRELSTLSIVTWLEKCTWSDDSVQAFCFVPGLLQGGFTYPDDVASSANFEDRLWVIDVESISPRQVYAVPSGIENAADPFYGAGSQRLNFWDVSKGSLFSLDVSDKVSLISN